MRVLRVVIADDHPFYRQGLAKLLARFEIEVVAQAANAVAAIQAVEQTRPDALVLDLNMPGLSGAEAIRDLLTRVPGTRVLVLSVSADEDDVADALVAGATGYMLKDSPVEDLVTAIRNVAAGKPVICPRIAAMIRQRA